MINVVGVGEGIRVGLCRVGVLLNFNHVRVCVFLCILREMDAVAVEKGEADKQEEVE